jgi:S1-C subfamily serine protease
MLGISQRDGVVVSRVARRSPAARARIEVGDVIVAIEETRVRSTTDVQRIINSFDVTEDSTMTLTVFREGKLQEVEMEVEKE